MKKTFTSVLGLALATMITFGPLEAVADQADFSGTFTGANDHITTGGVKIVKTANGGAVVILDSDFSLDGAPDPRVGLGKDGTYDTNADLGILLHNTGVQAFIVPPSINVDDYNEVYIWCLKFSVSLGAASLS
jgi:hypothetical protein